MKKNILLLLILVFGLINVSFGADYEYSKLSETLLNQDPDPAVPGQYVEIRFKVEKEGNEPLTDITYELLVEHPFSFDASDTPVKKLGDWVGNSDDKEFYILYYKLKVDENALEDTYELTLLQTSNSNSVTREKKFDIRVGEKDTPKLIYGKIKTTPIELIGNFDDAKLSIEIVNIGEGLAEQVIVDLELPETGFEESFGYSNRATLGSIEAGASKTADFYFDTKEGLNKGEYEAKLKITFKDPQEDSFENELKTVEMPFNIKIFGRPEYNIISYNVSDLRVGSKGEISLTIENIGSKESDSTSIQVFKDSSDPFSFEDKSIFLGKLDVNDKGEAVFKLDIDEDAIPKEYRLKLQIRSVVGSDVLVDDKTLVLNIEDKKAQPIGENIYMRLVLYALFFGVGLFVGKKITNKNTSKK